MNSMPSVWMNAGIRSLTTISPLTRPISAPTPTPPMIANATGQRGGGHQLGGDHGRQAGDRADRQVELAGDQQHRLADGDDADERHDVQDGAEVALGQERRLDEIEEGDQHDQGRDDTRLRRWR